MRNLLKLLAIFLLVGLASSPAGAVTFVLDAAGDAGDTNPGDGVCDSILAGTDCTLRAAVQEANALPGVDTIEVPTLLYTLNIPGSDDAAAVGDLDVTDDLVIRGVGSPTISITHGDRAIELRSGTLEIENVSLDGAGIRTLLGTRTSLHEVDITGATSTPVVNEGTLSAHRLELSANSGNFLVPVGAIDNSGTLLLASSRVTGNSASLAGSTDSSGGILNRAGATMLAVNVRIASNIDDNLGAAPAVCGQNIANRGSMSLQYVEVSGGITLATCYALGNAGDVQTRASIFLSGGLQPTCSGVDVVSLGYNTVWDTTCLASALPTDDETFTVFDGVPPELCPVYDLDLEVPSTDAGAATCERGANQLTSNRACNDGFDNDGDGLVDLQDPGCRDADDPVEAHLRPGDFVYTNFDTGGVSVLDPSTTLIAPMARALLSNPWDVEVDSTGEVLVAGWGMDSLLDLDLERGVASVVSGGGLLGFPTGIAISNLGEVFVAAETGGTLLEIDPTTGAQTTVATAPVDFAQIKDLVFEPGGDLLASTRFAGIHEVDPITGTINTTYSSDDARQLDIDLVGNALYSDRGAADAPTSLDLGTGVSTPLLTTPTFSGIRGMLQEPSGLVLVTDTLTGEIARVDAGADTATTLNFGREEVGTYYLATVPAAAEITLTLSDSIVIDGGVSGVVDVGDRLELVAVTTNTGATTADLLSIESGLDPNFTLVASSLSTTQGTIVEGSLASDPRLEVDLGSLAPAASATVTWQVDVADPAPAKTVTANAWVRREKIILAESDDLTTGPSPDSNVIPVGNVDIVIQAFQKLSDTRGEFSGSGNPGSVLADSDFLEIAEPVGDLDGDGVDDVALSTWSGAATQNLYLAQLRADGTVEQRIDIAQPPLVFPSDSYGRCTAYLGDLDGAGSSDFALAVASPFDDGNGTDRGAVHILFLQNDGTLVSSTRIADGGVGGLPNGTLANSDYFGTCVESLGDLDGPGGSPHAIAVGASADDAGGLNAGAVYVLFLNTNGTVSGSPVLITQGLGGFDGLIKEPGFSGNDIFGTSVEWLGDLDGDGNPEIAVGEERDDAAGLDAGALWIFSIGSSGQALTGAVKHDGTNPSLAAFSFAGSRFGKNRLARVSDLDGDGLPELLARSNSDTALLFLDSDKSIKKVESFSDALADVPELDSAVPFAAQELGDLDGDGRPEIAFAPGDDLDDDGGTDRGAVYVLYPDAIPVPEPGVLSGLISGIAFLAVIGRKRIRS